MDSSPSEATVIKALLKIAGVMLALVILAALAICLYSAAKAENDDQAPDGYYEKTDH